MRYAADRKSETRARVLAEAGKALRSDGPSKLGVADVMAKAGLTHGGFYSHFASKDDLVGAAIDAMFAQGANLLDRGGGLSRFVDDYLSPAHRDRRDMGCPLSYLAGDAPRLGADGRDRYAAGMARLRARLAAEMNGDEAAASSVLAEAVGALALARAEPDPARSDAILAASRAALHQRIAGRAT